MTDPVLVDGAALFAEPGDFVRIHYSNGHEGLARVIGWADNAGRPIERFAATYVVLIGDVSAGVGWDSPILLRMPEGDAV